MVLQHPARDRLEHRSIPEQPTFILRKLRLPLSRLYRDPCQNIKDEPFIKTRMKMRMAVIALGLRSFPAQTTMTH